MSIVTIDPSTGARLERFGYASRQDVDATLARADAAAAAWGSTRLDDRIGLLRNLARRLRAESEQLARTAVREMGKPLVQARAEVEKCARCCEYFAEHGGAMLADAPVASDASRSYVAFRPLGVVLAIMPWNFPYWQVFRAAVPALLAGNAMLLKHAENTTRCGLEIARLFTAAGAPAGLFTTLLVSNEDAARLIADRRVAAVTLTGSERAGAAVASAAGSALKKCVLELGGSDAFVVLDDADLAAAAKVAITSRFQNNGQSCIAAKRFILEACIHDEFLERFVAHARAQRIGNPMEETTQIGPLARRDLRDTLDTQIQATLATGATARLGARSIAGPGNFYQPTVIAGVTPGSPMFDQEVFGPAAAVIRAADAREALALANASTYGLGFNLWSRDIERAEAMAREAQAGSAFINGMVTSDPRLPFGGVKNSGYGRELSTFGLHEFTNVQTVWIGPIKG